MSRRIDTADDRPGPTWPDRRRLSTAMRLAVPVGLVFFAVYPAANWITTRRDGIWSLYLDWELAIPFIPQWIWIYLSMYPLLLLPPWFVPARHMPALARQLVVGTLAGGIAFLLIPGALGHARRLPADEPYHTLFETMFRLDAVHNVVPSLHVVYAASVGFACAGFARPAARWLLHAWVAAIALSTLLVHQHHLLDVAAAIALVGVLRRHWPIGRAPATARGITSPDVA